MSSYGDDYLTDPEYKLAIRGIGGGGRGPIGGGGSGIGSLSSFGGGGLLGSLTTTTGGNESALREILRRRFRLPGAASPAFMSPPAEAVPGSTSRFDTGGFAGTGTTMAPLTSDPFIPAGGGSNPWTSPAASPNSGARGGGGTLPGGPIRGIGGPMPVQGTDGSSGPGYGAGGGSGGAQHGRSHDHGSTGGADTFGIGGITELLDAFKKAGFFDPQPNQAIMDMTRSGAISDANALQQRNDLRAQSLGTDPATAASYSLRSGLEGQGHTADLVSGTALSQMQNKENFGQDILKQYIAGLLGANQQQDSGTDWGGALGGLGSIITALSGL